MASFRLYVSDVELEYLADLLSPSGKQAQSAVARRLYIKLQKLSFAASLAVPRTVQAANSPALNARDYSSILAGGQALQEQAAKEARLNALLPAILDDSISDEDRVFYEQETGYKL